jgi:Helix-turn-helix domain
MKSVHSEVVAPPMRAVASVDPEELIENAAAAKLIGVAPETLVQWRYQKRGPCFLKIGRLIRYRRADLAAWLAAQRRDPRAAAA